MLERWIQTDVDATWQKLLEAIDSPVVQNLSSISGRGDDNAGKYSYF